MKSHDSTKCKVPKFCIHNISFCCKGVHNWWMLMSDDHHFPASLGVSPQISGVWPSLTGGPEGRNFPSCHAWKPEITQTPRGFQTGFWLYRAMPALDLTHFFSESQQLIAWQSLPVRVTFGGGFKWREIYGAIFFLDLSSEPHFWGICFFWPERMKWKTIKTTCCIPCRVDGVKKWPWFGHAMI